MSTDPPPRAGPTPAGVRGLGALTGPRGRGQNFVYCPDANLPFTGFGAMRRRADGILRI